MEKEPEAEPQKQQHGPFQDHQILPKENIIEKLKRFGNTQKLKLIHPTDSSFHFHKSKGKGKSNKCRKI